MRLTSNERLTLLFPSITTPCRWTDVLKWQLFVGSRQNRSILRACSQPHTGLASNVPLPMLPISSAVKNPGLVARRLWRQCPRPRPNSFLSDRDKWRLNFDSQNLVGSPWKIFRSCRESQRWRSLSFKIASFNCREALGRIQWRVVRWADCFRAVVLKTRTAWFWLVSMPQAR